MGDPVAFWAFSFDKPSTKHPYHSPHYINKLLRCQCIIQTFSMTGKRPVIL